MQKIYKEYYKAQSAANSESNLDPMDDPMMHPPIHIQAPKRRDRDLSQTEKKYLLATERGDIIKVKKYLEEACANNEDPDEDDFDKNAMDPLGRNALHIAIEYENLEMMEVLLTHNVESNEAILHAINEEFVEAVELLLLYQDNGGQLTESDAPLDNIESQDVEADMSPETNSNNNQGSKSFTPDITPLILAAHKDNYEIIKILLDRGESIQEPHEIRCSCQDCTTARSEDSLRYSKSRINTYKALSSPSLMSLSCKDPILSAFKLSWELKRLSRIENEFKKDYEKMSQQCQEYASALLAETRTSQELEIILNHDHENPPALFENETEKTSLSRLKLAIRYKQKRFVAHPHCQQLLVRLWYEGITGYRRHNIAVRLLIILLTGLIFPILSLIYLLLPYTKVGKILRQPFIKFVCHSASYMVFLSLLILASLRMRNFLSESESDNNKEKRGPTPTTIEWMIYVYVLSFIWNEIKQLWSSGLMEYLNDWWNLLDFTTNTLYITTIVLKLIAYMIVKDEIAKNQDTHSYLREQWDPWDPTLIGEGLFAIANIFSTLKLICIFTINPHLGPLQITLGRMLPDIIRFLGVLFLVIFSFSCGLNQLLWYYAQMRKNHCNAIDFMGDAEQKEECFMKVKYFENLFETLQTMYWGIYGFLEKDRLEYLYTPHTFTMFVALLMFGCYSAVMITILLNLLIAVMNNSYQIIVTLFWAIYGHVEKDRLEFLYYKHRFTIFIGLLMFGVYCAITLTVVLNLLIAIMNDSYRITCTHNQADEEWKFARSRLLMSYFDEGGTLPAPFNLVPSPKSVFYFCQWCWQKIFCLKKLKRKQARWLSIRKVMKKISEREYKYHIVIKELVKRYIMRKQQRDLDSGVTEDDLNEIKQDIASFRFELLEIFKSNKFKVDDIKKTATKRRRGKLNLEKTMSKNMFEDPKNQRIDLFSNFKNILPADSDLLKKSYQQSVINATQEFKAKCSEQSMKEVQETHKKAKVQIVEPNDLEQPAMFKIALKIKKLTEEKFNLKKQPSTDSSKICLSSGNLANQDLKSCIKKSSNFEETKLFLAEENLLTEEVDELENASGAKADPPKASPDQTTEIEVDPKTSDSDFTERITEV